jgi:hypothetical protein
LDVSTSLDIGESALRCSTGTGTGTGSVRLRPRPKRMFDCGKPVTAELAKNGETDFASGFGVIVLRASMSDFSLGSDNTGDSGISLTMAADES